MSSINIKCSKCGESFACDQVLTVCTKCNGALLFQYDLTRFAEGVSRSVGEKRKPLFGSS